MQVVSPINAVIRDVLQELEKKVGRQQGQNSLISREMQEVVERLQINAACFCSNLVASFLPEALRLYAPDTAFNLREHMVSDSNSDENSVEQRIAHTLIPAYIVGEDVMGEALVQLKRNGMTSNL
ncbi:hypothetical protein KDW_38850 [Dictyobacter vulcani]|uniref:Uncharacterized protein n=1 Tax=Dictyobacter vulcani TaxID=2607529 RepID=A0A5J4KQ55_9CHLR|nr:hypothetical protein [Dictyobacter vulcani]GER89723.1 hypothetical protein KDW_38850 [Dictyobacter vulcani]